MIDLGPALGGMREATAEIVGNSLVSYLKVPGPTGEIDIISTRSINPSKYFTFQYGQVIKLPLQILQSIHGQPYGNEIFQYGPVIKLPLHISHMVDHMALTNAQRLQF